MNIGHVAACPMSVYRFSRVLLSLDFTSSEQLVLLKKYYYLYVAASTRSSGNKHDTPNSTAVQLYSCTRIHIHA